MQSGFKFLMYLVDKVLDCMPLNSGHFIVFTTFYGQEFLVTLLDPQNKSRSF